MAITQNDEEVFHVDLDELLFKLKFEHQLRLMRGNYTEADQTANIQVIERVENLINFVTASRLAG